MASEGVTRDDLAAALMVLGWSRAELARRLGVHANTASAWAKGGAPRYVRAYLELAVAVKRSSLLIDGGD